jgi:hypothetical protein
MYRLILEKGIHVDGNGKERIREPGNLSVYRKDIVEAGRLTKRLLL